MWLRTSFLFKGHIWRRTASPQMFACHHPQVFSESHRPQVESGCGGQGRLPVDLCVCVYFSSKDRKAKQLVFQTLKSHDYGAIHTTSDFALSLDNLGYCSKANATSRGCVPLGVSSFLLLSVVALGFSKQSRPLGSPVLLMTKEHVHFT